MPTFDETKYQLGTLCKRGHDFEDTGQTLRTWNGSCVQCEHDRNQEG